jgi:mannose/fructose/N-acetylgalactosamine-specific phosphotransferase system component IID
MKMFNMKTRIITGMAVVGSMVSSVASAALPAAAGTAFTDLQTDGLALLDLAWPVVAAITIGFIAVKLFKKAANKV